MPDERPAIGLYLRFLGGSFDPAQVTKHLGIAPTREYRAGEAIPAASPLIPATGATHRHDGWLLSVGPFDTFSIDQLLLEFQEQVGMAAGKVRELCEDLNLNAVVRCGVVQPVDASTPHLNFPEQFLVWVAGMGATLEVDVILSGDSPAEPAPLKER